MENRSFSYNEISLDEFLSILSSAEQNHYEIANWTSVDKTEMTVNLRNGKVSLLHFDYIG